jgi:glycogen debranching enzyme
MKVEKMTIPFSRYGSFLVISPVFRRDSDQKSLYIRHIRGGDEKNGAIFKIDVVRGNEVIDYEVEMEPHVLKLIAMDGSSDIVECCFSSDSSIRIRGHRAGLKLTAITGAYDYALPFPDQTWEINSFVQERRFRIIPLEGSVQVDAPFKVDKSKHIIVRCHPDSTSQIFDFAISEYQLVFEQEKSLEMSFSENALRVANEYKQWQENSLNVPAIFQKGHDMASYITWSSVVKPDGLLTRPAMYMSKNWMTNIWSWDHCFNAMALIEKQPELAWDQFCIFFDQQDESGALPDFLNNQWALWNCCKPPIHGWTLKWMMDRSDFIDDKKLKEVYTPLARWTNWWFFHRDDDLDGIAQYNHGNDSGWDNSTVFSKGIPVETPDLSAFLIIQMDVLAMIAERLEKMEEAIEWKLRADKTFMKMMDHFWTGEGFRACISHSHEPIETESLLLYIPLILGERLTNEQKEILIDGLVNRHYFCTEYGFATESVKSPFYREDGYWRGPIWAPSTMLLIDGLQACGKEELARTTAEKFCKMANQSGMAENFNALTGKGLRDPAFTWTSSVFLIAGHMINGE